RSPHRPHAGCVHHGAGDAALLRQFPRRLPRREQRTTIGAPCRLLPRDAALPRLAESSALPERHPAPWHHIPLAHELPVRNRRRPDRVTLQRSRLSSSRPLVFSSSRLLTTAGSTPAPPRSSPRPSTRGP